MNNLEEVLHELEKTRERMWEAEANYRKEKEQNEKLIKRGKEVKEERDYYKNLAEVKQEERDRRHRQEGVLSSFLTYVRKAIFVGKPPEKLLETALDLIVELTSDKLTNGAFYTKMYADAGEPWAMEIEVERQKKRLNKMKESYEREPSGNLRIAIDQTEKEILRLMGEIHEENIEESA